MDLISNFFQGTVLSDTKKVSKDIDQSIENINESVSFSEEKTNITIKDKNNIDIPETGSAKPSFKINDTIYDVVDLNINSKVFQAMINSLKIESDNTDEVLKLIDNN